MVLLRIMVFAVALGIPPTAFWIGGYIDSLYQPLEPLANDPTRCDTPLDEPPPQP